MDDEEHNRPKPRHGWALLVLRLVTYFFAYWIVLPLFIVLRIAEALGVFCVALGAGLLAYSIYGLYTSNGRSVMMWTLLLFAMMIPILYYKVQFDSDAISDARRNIVAENLYRFFTKKLGMDTSDESSTEVATDKDQA